MLEWPAEAHSLAPLQVDIHDGTGTLVVRVRKTLYVRLRPQARQA
jgi:hypothetical protein